MKLPIGISNFKKLIDEDYDFIDKTLLIKDILEDGAQVILIPRPRRFGKTLNLSMLSHFLKIKEERKHTTQVAQEQTTQYEHHQEDLARSQQNLFANLLISKHTELCLKHQNRYPVIFISFKDVKKATYMAAYERIVELIASLYESYRYLLEDDLLSGAQKDTFESLLQKKPTESALGTSLHQLSKHLSNKFNQPPIILIDEYDTPIQEAYLRGYYDQMVSVMRSLMGAALKDNEYMHKAIITGITRISQESLFSGVNNLVCYSILREKYGQYFGFLEDEVAKLIAKSECQTSLDKIKEWYNGYQVGRYTLYNPWSILNYLSENGALKPYWLNTASPELLEKLIGNSKPFVKQQLESLLQGNVIEQPISENLVFRDIEVTEDALWTLLLYTGYLKALSYELKGYQFVAELQIPNFEVGFVYNQILSQWFSRAISTDSYNRFLKSLVTGDMERFKAYLSAYIMQSGSYFDFNTNTPESVFHAFILGMVVGLKDQYIIESNKESGFGRVDVTLIPKTKTQKDLQDQTQAQKSMGIIIEFKMAKSEQDLKEKASSALDQIKEKEYIQVFAQNGIDQVLAIGIAFYGKELELVSEVVKV